MDIKPYIGITDFSHSDQVVRMLQVLNREKEPDSEILLHVGVMMSHKTLHGLPTKYSGVWPKNEEISEIFELASPDVYYCLHYADYNFQTTANDLVEGIGYAGPWVDAIQLDMPWPDPGMVAHAVHTSRKNLEVILQVGKGAFAEAGDDPKEIVRRLEDYEGVIHRVLLDKSMGRGHGMDAYEFLPFARAIKERFPKIGLVAAGGLGPNTMPHVEPLVKEFSDISIDAQGKLRPSGDSTDPIDWFLAEEYLLNALKLFKQIKNP